MYLTTILAHKKADYKSYQVSLLDGSFQFDIAIQTTVLAMGLSTKTSEPTELPPLEA